MLIADITYSPDDGGYYATVWDKDTGKEHAVLPKDGVVSELKTLEYMVRSEYDDIRIMLLNPTQKWPAEPD